MLDEAPPLSENDLVTLEVSTSKLRVPSNGNWFAVVNYSKSTDDTRFDFILEARLLEDRQTIEFRYEGAFYEDPPDCEFDTAPSSE